MENEVPFFATHDDFFKAANMPPSKYDGLYVDVLDKLWTHPSLEVPPFKHNSYAIKLLLKGEGVMRIGQWKENLKAPAIFISPPNQIVSCEMVDDDILEYAVIISHEFVEKHLRLNHFISVFEYFQAEKSAPIVITDDEMTDLEKVFHYINDEYKSEIKSDSLEMMASAILIFYMKIKRLYSKYSLEIDEENNESKKIDSLSNRFLKLLHEDSQNLENVDYNIAYFASKLAVHPNYLSSKLKTETGKSAKEHLDAKLIHNAKTLLQQTDFSVKEIAFKLNFKESSHFVNFFKKQTAETPSEFRKEYQ
ncbi:helix-turn-helix transcriptional regulator [Chryseobacterium sp. 09-1422]|uniref:Helix-turn-helix transcriptional regulator n=1 Tax=Chryseobacterium kimseyorum TaxID=2984028 RepID=A0ABT3I2N4_9FLAO|nr:response regulator transcription factor [Chryseobacterium kimseyorum]MCW3170244.1 helix-turn-helix transcriptional regulator [Chryseobacterium kimseyorum]